MKRLTSNDQCLYFHSWRIALVLIAAVSIIAGMLGVSAPQAHAATSLPCDIYAAAGTPCVAAHSTVRALYAAYDGSLYQVQRRSDSTTLNIDPLAAGGYADAAAQDSFCADTSCIITEIYDQSGEGNNLTIERAGSNGGQDHGANAVALPITAGGHEAYGVYVSAGVGYRDDSTSGVATDGAAEGMYMVTRGTHVNSGCCFDYGNAETTNSDNGNGHMDAINFGTECWFSPCSGSGPWVQADMENGLFAGGNGSNTNNTGNSSAFVTALLKNNGQNTYAIKGGNAQSGSLSTWYSGAEPDLGGYAPMNQEGAIVLGTGGDDSNSSVGSFFEGVMTSGYPTDAADNAVQANIVSVGYSGSSPAYYHIVNRNSGLVMDVSGASLSAGADIIQWPDNSGYNQEWSLVPTGDGYYDLVNRSSGQLADVSGASTTEGTDVIQWRVNGGYNQEWRLVSTSGYYDLVNRNSGQLADVSAASTTEGANIIQWPSDGGNNQEWSLVAV